MSPTRREFLCTLAASPLVVARPSERAAPLRPLRMLLNSGYTGANAWFLLGLT